MTDRIVSDAVDALGFARQGVIGEAANIPADQWDFRPHPDAKSVSEVVRHVIDSTLMLVGEAADPAGDFTRRPPADHIAAHAGHLPKVMTRSELLQALESTLDTCNERIRAVPAAHWMTDITRFDGQTWARVTYLFYAASHDQYHAGQLTAYARALDLVPALTKRIHGTSAG